MKKKHFSSVLCCLLAAVCLFSGCERKSPLLVHADDVGELKTDYAAIDLIHHFGYSIENGEGETISRVPETASHEDGKPDEGDKDIVGGTMEYSKEEKQLRDTQEAAAGGARIRFLSAKPSL